MLFDNIDYKLNGISHERLDLDIPFLSHQSILADRDSALKKTLNISPTEVKAKLRFKGITYKSDIYSFDNTSTSAVVAPAGTVAIQFPLASVVTV